MELNREKINICLARNEMTLSQLAEDIGYSRSRIYTILSRKKVTPMVAGRVARALKVDVAEIIETKN